MIGLQNTLKSKNVIAILKTSPEKKSNEGFLKLIIFNSSYTINFVCDRVI